MSRNPFPHPLLLIPLVLLFIVLAGGVCYLVSPLPTSLPTYQREVVVAGTAGEPTLVTTTHSSRGRQVFDLPPDQQYWKQKVTFTGVHGERGEALHCVRAKAGQPPAGVTVGVRYTPDPTRPAGGEPVKGRMADGLEWWTGAELMIGFFAVMALIAVGAGWQWWAKWAGAEAVVRRVRAGELTDEQAAEGLAWRAE